jgi:PIN domain nuclease of toxin-antitoxin system
VIKVRLGKWPEAAVLLPGLDAKVRDEGFETLDLTLAQAEYAGGLELVHKDPFDRLIAAQSLLLDIPIATVDPAMTRLGCRVV